MYFKNLYLNAIIIIKSNKNDKKYIEPKLKFKIF